MSCHASGSNKSREKAVNDMYDRNACFVLALCPSLPRTLVLLSLCQAGDAVQGPGPTTVATGCGAFAPRRDCCLTLAGLRLLPKTNA